MFKRSLLSFVLVASLICPAAALAGDGQVVADLASQVGANAVALAADAANAVAAVESATDVIKEVPFVATEILSTDVAPEAAGIAAKIFKLVSDNKLAFGAAAVIATTVTVAALAWYCGYFQKAENNQVA